MGIKQKRKGPMPIFPHRWQELAKDPNRHSEAVREYRVFKPSVSLVEASRAIRAFRNSL